MITLIISYFDSKSDQFNPTFLYVFSVLMDFEIIKMIELTL